MKNLTLATLFVCCSALPLFAQQDDCPPNHVRHPALTALDDASMLAAYTASYRGIFHQDPSMRAGAGAADGWYWIHAANHYGVYGDDQCHAGWSGYWESWLKTGHGDLALVQSPAQFQPDQAPPPIVIIPAPPNPPNPPTLPSVVTCDMTATLQQFDILEHEVRAVQDAVTTLSNDEKSRWDKVFGVIGKYGPAVAAAFLAGKKL